MGAYRQQLLKRILLSITLFVSILLGAADNKKLNIIVVQKVNQPRFNTPIPVDVLFNWKGTAVITGRLRFIITQQDSVLLNYTTGEISLTNGDQRRHFILPATNKEDSYAKGMLEVEFISDEGSWRFPKQLFFLPNFQKRNLVVGVIKGEFSEFNKRRLIARSLFMEQLDFSFSKKQDLKISTTMVDIPAKTVPVDPLKLCSYDVLVVAREGLGLLKEKQMNALKKWVLAGGSLCLYPADYPVKQYHVDDLNELVKQSQYDLEHFQLSDSSNVALNDPENAAYDSGIGLYHAGLGRMAVIFNPLNSNEDYKQNWWFRMVAFLWKIKHSRVLTVMETGKVFSTKEIASRKAKFVESNYYYRYNKDDVDISQIANMGYGDLALNNSINSMLFPKNVNFLPFKLIILLLLGFLLIIGPIDYWFLGVIKKRYLTWIIFPCLSILCFLLFFYLSELFLGGRDNIRSLTVIDVGKDGRILRKSVFDTLFYGTQKERILGVDRKFMTAYPSKLGEDQYNYSRNYEDDYMRELRFLKTASFKGNYPFKYDCQYRLPQWFLCKQRSFQIEAEEKIDFLAENKVNLDSEDSVNSFIKQCRSSLGKITVDFYPAVSFPSLRNSGIISGIYGLNSNQPNTNNKHYQQGAETLSFFNVVSAVSPKGGKDVEDMMILDETNPLQKLVVITHQDGDNYVVYRQFIY